jgi:site-specific DNA recombinase
MTPSHTGKNGSRFYRYYVCSSAQKRGRTTCLSKSVPAGAIEGFVIDRIRCIGRDADLLREVLNKAHERDEQAVSGLQAERHALEQDIKAWHREVNRLSGRFRSGDDHGDATVQLANLAEQIGEAEAKLRRVQQEIDGVDGRRISEADAARALAAFDPVWGALTPREQGRLIDLLVERVDYDGARGTVSVTFRPSGIKSLADEVAQEQAVQPREKRA